MCEMEKAALRRQVRALWQGKERRDWESECLCAHVLAWPAYARASCVAAYMPLAREANVTPVLADCLKRGKTLLLPRVESAGQMTLRRVTAWSQLRPGAFGLLEPGEEAETISPEMVELVLVPLEAVDEHGVRLGKGGGYYDRMLANCHALTLGAALSWQWVARVPREEWDQPLQAVADWKGIHLFAQDVFSEGKDG